MPDVLWICSFAISQVYSVICPCLTYGHHEPCCTALSWILLCGLIGLGVSVLSPVGRWVLGVTRVLTDLSFCADCLRHARRLHQKANLTPVNPCCTDAC